MTQIYDKILHLAHTEPRLRQHLIPLLRAHKRAMEFDTPKALEKYLKEHPDADKSKHHIKKKDEKDTGNSEGEKSHPKVKVPQDIGGLMQQYSDGRADIYQQVGSFATSGHAVDSEKVDEALQAVAKDLAVAKAGKGGWGKTEVTELTKIQKALKRLTGR